jgi:drug/metabolite transporter (DMT)-like permease
VRARDLPFLAVFGIFGLALVHFADFKTISLTGVATAILLEYLAPVVVLIFSVSLLREKLTWALPAAVLLSVSG